MEQKLRIIISGGGTGGHIFPAVSIANAIRAKHPDADILFVGALGRMEMQRVPDAGYKIVGLPICGFDRKNMFKNFAVLYKIWKSQRMAKQIIRRFKPMAAALLKRPCQLASSSPKLQGKAGAASSSNPIM